MKNILRKIPLLGRLTRPANGGTVAQQERYAQWYSRKKRRQPVKDVDASILAGGSADDQESMIAENWRERRTALRHAVKTLESLREQADWFGRVIDFSDAATWGDPGTAFILDRRTMQSRALVYPGATASAYINEVELRQLRARSRAFVLVNPYWLAVAHSRRSYTIGSGHAYKVMPKDEEETDELRALLADVAKELEDFRRVNRYRKRQAEKLSRLDRDGEFFLRYFEQHPDGILRVRFVEPILVSTPPGKSVQDDVWFGIQYAGDYEEPRGYYVRNANYLGTSQADDAWRTMVPAEEIQHRTANVDLSSPRGLPTTYALESRLEQALKTLTNMGSLVEFRTKVGLIRKHVAATTASVKALLGDRGGLGYSNSAGGLNPTGTLDKLPTASIIDTNDQTSYEFPTTNTDVEKIVASVQADLRSVAAALGLAEYMISADASNSNYASTMVAEGSPVKTFEGMQTDLIEDDIEVLEHAIRVAIKHGRLPEDTLDRVKIAAEPPVIVSRNRLAETQADEILNRNDVMGKRTWRARNGLDNDAEREEIELEKEASAGYALDGDGDLPPNGMKPPDEEEPPEEKADSAETP